jgi:hypothetical protein
MASVFHAAENRLKGLSAADIAEYSKDIEARSPMGESSSNSNESRKTTISTKDITACLIEEELRNFFSGLKMDNNNTNNSNSSSSLTSGSGRTASIINAGKNEPLV